MIGDGGIHDRTCRLGCEGAVSVDRVVGPWRRATMNLKAEDAEQDEGRGSNADCRPHPVFTQEVEDVAPLWSMDNQVAAKALPVALEIRLRYWFCGEDPKSLGDGFREVGAI